MSSKPVHGSLAAAATNFCSAFNSVFFCTLAALYINLHCPIFHRQALNVLFVSAVYTAPLLVTGVLAHYLNTRFATRNVIVFCKGVEILLTAFGTVAFVIPGASGVSFLLAAAAMLGAEYSIYRPAIKMYIAEHNSVQRLPRAGAAVESAIFAGIVLGTITAVLVFKVSELCHERPWIGASLTVLIAVYSLLLSRRIGVNLPAKKLVHFSELPRRWLDSLKLQPRYRELVLTGMSECYIVGSVILMSALSTQYIDVNFGSGNATSELHLYSILCSTAIGTAVGCVWGAWRSRKTIEIGLIPPATLAMTVTALLVSALPYYSDVYIESGLLALLLFVFGFFAGSMLIPVQAYQARFVKKELRPAFFSWFYFPFGLAILLAIGIAFLMCHFNIPLFNVTLGFAVLTVILAAVTFFFMPQFLWRTGIRLLTATLYRLRIYRIENLPQHGPALLVSNRASFVDMLFISACTPRPVRFMMHESYYRFPLLHPFYKTGGVLEVPVGKPKKLRQLFARTRRLLRKGELICLFPEGDITRNGVMSSFRDGMREMLPRDVEVPIIPIYIGMTWGSIFSCYNGKFKLRWPNELPHPASVTIGKPIPPDTTGYGIRVAISELGADTELIPSATERPFHSQFAFIMKHHPFRKHLREYSDGKLRSPGNFTLLMRSVLLSRHLRSLCDSDEECVGIMLPNSLDLCTSLVAVQMADRVPAVLNYTAQQRAVDSAVERAKVRHIVTRRDFLDKLKFPERPGMIFLDELDSTVLTPWRKFTWFLAVVFLNSEELMKLLAPVTWNDVEKTAVILFSSGSTGLPKGVMLSHHNINADVTSITKVIGWSRNDRIAGNLPLFHSFGMTVSFWMPVITGAETTMLANPLDTTAMGEIMLKRKTTLLVTTPGFLQFYMRRCPKEAFSSLRLTITGAEKLRDDIAERFRRLTGLTIAEGYGCTELSPVVSINLANSRMELGAQVAELGSIGPPLPGICVKIVNPDTFELLPENTDGLMIVKGATVMQGYLDDPEKTSEVMRDGKWYVTGDIARMNRNGFITITGRMSRFSKIAGEMVPHELVEKEITNLLRPEDRLFAVCGGSDTRKGERLLVFYTDRTRLDPHEVVQALNKLPIPKLWIPKEDSFVLLPELPVLGSGKLDLAKLAEMAQNFCTTGDPLTPPKSHEDDAQG